MCTSLFGNDEEDIRYTFCNSRSIQVIACISFVFFIVLIYITVDCYILNSARECTGVTVLSSLACIVCIVCISVLLRWKYCWNKQPTIDTVVDTTLVSQANPNHTSSLKLSKSSKKSSRKSSISPKLPKSSSKELNDSKESKESKESNESMEGIFAYKNPMEPI